MKYAVEATSMKTITDWSEISKKFKSEDLYIGGLFGLCYNLNFHEFLNKDMNTDFVSVLFICNSLGLDKRELLVSGNQIFDESIRSLPVCYSYNNTSQLNKYAIENYFNKIDEDLKTKKKSINLVINIPEEFLRDLKLSNINLFCLQSIEYTTSLDLLTNCIKHNYRKLQITKNVLRVSNSNNDNISTEYIFLLCMAWTNVSPEYITRLFNGRGGLDLHNYGDVYSSKNSITYWCRMHNVTFNESLYGSFDDYIAFDKNIPTLCLSGPMYDPNNRENLENEAISGIDAFQAMKRLVSFLHSKNADQNVMKSARSLENHLEYNVLLEVHSYVKGEPEPEAEPDQNVQI